MKKIFFIFLSMFVLTACTINLQSPPPDQSGSQASSPPPPPPHLTPEEKEDLKKGAEEAKKAMTYAIHSFHCHEEHTCDQ